jgi:hypothetical protein
MLVAKRGWQGNAEREAVRARLQIGLLAPERERLIAKRRRRRPATRHLLHLEQALDLFNFILIFDFIL